MIRKLVKKIKHNIVYNIIIMLDKVKEYDKNENFSDYIIDPELQRFVSLSSHENMDETVGNKNNRSTQSKPGHPSDELLKKGMRDLYSNRN